jgi:hypothetical protein
MKNTAAYSNLSANLPPQLLNPKYLEPPREIVALTRENAHVYSLQLDGLGAAARKILREKDLLEPEKGESLIKTYRGNPLWLKIVAAMIQELFGGRVAEFLKYDMLFLEKK